jgi:hypothetical protein
MRRTAGRAFVGSKPRRLEDDGYKVRAEARHLHSLVAHFLFVVLNQREDVEALEFCAAIQEGQLDGEGQALYFAA